MDYEAEIKRLEGRLERMEQGMARIADVMFGPPRSDMEGGGRRRAEGMVQQVADLWERGANGGPGLHSAPSPWTRGQKIAVAGVLVSSLSSATFVIASVLG